MRMNRALCRSNVEGVRHRNAGRLFDVAALAVPAIVVLLLLAIDRSPRFMMGDSLSYLSTGLWGLMPPDRSWLFGYLARGLMDLGGSVETFVAVQAMVLLILILLARRCFPGNGPATACYLVFAVVAAADPLIEIYARFYMSDFLSAALFLLFVGWAAHCLALPNTGSASRGSYAKLFVLLVIATGSVFLRIAAAAQELLTIVLCLPAFLPRDRRCAILLAGMLPIPIAAVALLASANAIAYGNRFGHHPFVNKLSGVFLMGVFAPALQPADFRAVGIPLDPPTFAALRTGDFSRRGNQVWDTTGQTVRLLLEKRFRATNPYDAQVDATSRALVVHALERDPLAFTGVAAISTADYFVPRYWRMHLDQEMDQRRDLPRALVDIVDQRSSAKITALTDRRQTFLLRELEFGIQWYPFLLGAGVVLACIALARRTATPVDRVLGAGLIGTVLAAGLYANFVIPRYVLAAVGLSYLLAARNAVTIAPPAARLFSRR